MRVEHDFADGDALMHALIATGGHDPEFLTDDQLGGRAAAPAGRRLPRLVRDAARGRCARRSRSRWGPAPGDRYVDGDDLVVAGLELGERRRGDPAAARLRRGSGRHLPRPRAAARPTTTSPATAGSRRAGARTPSSTSASTARWSGCPARCSRSSESCAPDAALGSLPLVYPFVVNDPGRGRAGQAPRPRHDRRPPRAADDARRHLRRDGRAGGAARRVRAPGGARPVQAARPRCAHLVGDRARQPAGRPRHPRAARGRRQARRAHRRLPVRGQGHPGQGRPARARPRAARASSCAGSWRPCCGSARATCRACARAVGAAFGLDEPALVAAGGAPVAAAPAGLVERFRGPSASAGDLVDRLEDAHMALLDALAARDWTASAAAEVCAEVLGLRRRRRRARAALRLRPRSCRGSCARPTS